MNICNELLLVCSIFIMFGGVLVWYKLFGERGLFAWTVFATISANIEVLILVDAFGIEQTLGNVMFASTFLVTDILSETAGKKRATQAVNLGIAASLTFIVISQLWLLYTPNENDWAFGSISEIFAVTPRLMLVSLAVYAIVQRLDVFLYHKWWEFTERKSGDRRSMLWLRNNGSTLISQFFNSILFNFGAFWGIYELKTLIMISLAGYAVYIVTTLADTPAIYMARRICEKHREQKKGETV